jgi:hypothetical protein
VKVFVDFHHGDLYWSLHKLFEERLGWELYRPIGTEWFSAGFWKIAEPYGNSPYTISQFLDYSGKQEEPLYGVPYRGLNEKVRLMQDLTIRIHDPTHDYWHKAVTLPIFKSMGFDLIISCYGPPHDAAFDRLRDLYQPKAKRMAQMGNVFQRTTQRHVLHSSPYVPPPWQHTLYYHQEIDQKLYYPTAPNPETRRIYSMVNCLPHPKIYQNYKRIFADVEFRAFGSGCPDGALQGAVEVAPKMREANLGWHIKPHDGFGHTAMGWMASGRGVITRMKEIDEYGLDAPRLFVPGETCVLAQCHLDYDAPWDTPQHGIEAIRVALKPEECARLGANARKRFEEVCNYEAEFPQIKAFLDEVMS